MFKPIRVFLLVFEESCTCWCTCSSQHLKRTPLYRAVASGCTSRVAGIDTLSLHWLRRSIPLLRTIVIAIAVLTCGALGNAAADDAHVRPPHGFAQALQHIWLADHTCAGQLQ